VQIITFDGRVSSCRGGRCEFIVSRRALPVKLKFHDADTDTDILARIVAGTSDTRDFLKLFLWQAGRHADTLATILARMSARMSVSVLVSVSWNANYSAYETHLHVAVIQRKHENSIN